MPIDNRIRYSTPRLRCFYAGSRELPVDPCIHQQAYAPNLRAGRIDGVYRVIEKHNHKFRVARTRTTRTSYFRTNGNAPADDSTHSIPRRNRPSSQLTYYYGFYFRCQDSAPKKIGNVPNSGDRRPKRADIQSTRCERCVGESPSFARVKCDLWDCL